MTTRAESPPTVSSGTRAHLDARSTRPPMRFGTREWQLAYGVALRVLKAPDQAEDAAQEAMLRAFRARDTFSGAARFESWLHRIAFTTALSFLRKPHYRYHGGAPGDEAADAVGHLVAADVSPEDSANAAQLAERLAGCLRTMREVDRVAFTERFLYGTTERELGELLGVSPNAAKQRAFRARRHIRRRLQSYRAGAGGAATPDGPDAVSRRCEPAL